MSTNKEKLKERKIFIASKVIPFLKNHNPLDLLKDDELYLEYCRLYHYPFNIKELPLDRRYKKLREHLGQVKSRSSKEVKKTDKIENQVLVQKIKSVKTKVKNKDIFGNKKSPTKITIKEETEIKTEYKNIKKVSFSSPATKLTVEKLEIQTRLLHDYTKDYVYFLNGGQEETEDIWVQKVVNGIKINHKILRKRHLFPSLLLRTKFQQKMETMMANVSIDADKTESIKELESLKKQIDLAIKVEQAPIELINKLSEGGFNMQKELQGAILNDKAMIESGIVELETPLFEVQDNAVPQPILDLMQATEALNAGDI
jgi:hypothetical protein